MPRKIRDTKIQNSRRLRQERLDKEEEPIKKGCVKYFDGKDFIQGLYYDPEDDEP